VVTLGLLVLAATLLVGIGRASIAHALAARTEQADLQRRWGEVSCRNAVLPYADNILAIHERMRNRPVPVMRVALDLGGQRFTLILSDEQAKANVNSLLERTDKSRAESRIRDAVAGSGLGNSVTLRPEPLPPRQATSQPTAYAGPPQWITGFGQIFNNVLPDRLIAGAGVRPAEQLTCWGNGGINVMRVSDAALRLAATPQMSGVEVGRLIDARNAAFEPRARARLITPGVNGATPAGADAVTALLAGAHVDPKARRAIGFSARSTCFSLWVITQDPRRTWYRLYVIEDSDAKQPRVQAFAW
jgi:hypothetical protein